LAPVKTGGLADVAVFSVGYFRGDSQFLNLAVKQMNMGKKLVSLGEVKNLVDEFATANRKLLAGIDFVIGVARGGLVPAALLATRIDKPLIAAYINKSDEIFFDRSEWIKDKRVLVVDDVIRSGKTMRLLADHLNEISGPREVIIFTLYSVATLNDAIYGVSALSRRIIEDVIFPWDNQDV
jgi:hypoxanthine phosphoribosyltransferase